MASPTSQRPQAVPLRDLKDLKRIGDENDARIRLEQQREAARLAAAAKSRAETELFASADFRVEVSTSSARDGRAAPLGWLCASTTLAAFSASARMTTSRG